MSKINYFSQSKILKHSIATPVTNILLNAELASKTSQFSSIKPNYFNHLDQILVSAKYLSSILKLADDNHPDDCSDFYPKNALMEILNIAKKPQTRIQIVAHLNIDSDLRLQGNQFYFQEAIICILNNACEAYKNTALDKTILIVCSVYKNNLIINISDGGRGITWLEKQKIYFSNYSRKSNHSGVGINFAKKIVCHHFHGSFKIISFKNKGTTIRISLPISNLK